MNLSIVNKELKEPDCEFVERKGKGHPDTLSDALSEKLSVVYSNYTLKHFGAVLHHNFDKVGMLGGASFVRFGEGYLTKPIRILLNGRASLKFGDESIPVEQMLISTTKEFMKQRFPMIDVEKDLEFHYNLSTQSSPGKTAENGAEKGTRQRWFEPRTLNDLQEIREGLFSNDTSLGVGYAPYSCLESLVLEIEETLNSDQFRCGHPWIGSDIKIMGFRNRNEFDITLCIPQISTYVQNEQEYRNNLDFCKKIIRNLVETKGIQKFDLHVNTRDNYEKSELYLTATGSSIESGDEGLVGRGNRINGVISPMRLMSMEGACGKNPVYHIGKLYYVAAMNLSNLIYDKFNIRNEVSLVSQSGRDLLDPWIVQVNVPEKFKDKVELSKFVREELKKIPDLTSLLLNEKIRLY